MRKIILSMMVTVDGLTEGKKPEENWHNWNEEMSGYMMNFFQTVDTFIYGRKSYEEMIEFCTPKPLITTIRKQGKSNHENN